MDNTKLLKEKIEASIRHYAKAGIEIKEVEWDETEDGFNNGLVRKVVITQKKLINGYILNQKQLVERAKEIFADWHWNVKVVPVVFSLQVDDITEEWIEAKMDEFGIKRNDLVKQLALDKSYLSLLFAEPGNKRKIHLSKPMKATFFYYFLTYELNRDFREQLA